MDGFIACVCDNDLSVLCTEGTATAEQLAGAWSSVFYEYCDLMGTSEISIHKQAAYELNLMQLKERCASGWVNIMHVLPNEETAACLRILGYDFEFNDNSLTGDLARIRAELAFLRLQIKLKEVELETLTKNRTTESETIDRSVFAMMFHRFSAYYKFQWFPHSTSVEQYCMAIRDIMAHNEQAKYQKGKKK